MNTAQTLQTPSGTTLLIYLEFDLPSSSSLFLFLLLLLLLLPPPSTHSIQNPENLYAASMREHNRRVQEYLATHPHPWRDDQESDDSNQTRLEHQAVDTHRESSVEGGDVSSDENDQWNADQVAEENTEHAEFIDDAAMSEEDQQEDQQEGHDGPDSEASFNPDEDMEDCDDESSTERETAESDGEMNTDQDMKNLED
ncbi:hypothetical protein FHETE_8807 [Fusarium heterosporum]|uniref:Uncharacterized protein n=1 Tax=Fusarium heterosporum TaxID=42747 RepID=A0A8H5WJD1_FUSHE|nr:hypothetical protein FHETE_8807 [Fusarium heterosporum]